MPTCVQALEFYKKAVKDGKGHMHTGHPYISEEEQAKREAGAPNAEGKPKTKISWDAADQDSYREWHIERRRWMEAADHNPTLATDAMIVALKAYSLPAIAIVIETLSEMRTAQSGVPRVEIPTELLEASVGQAEGR